LRSDRARWAAPAVLVAASLVGGCSETTPGAPLPTQVIPSEGPRDRSTEVLIVGTGFNPLVKVDYNNGKRSFVSTAFTVRLGSRALREVRYQDATRLAAEVPSGLEAGSYDLTVVDPRGQEGTLASAFVVLEGAGDAGPDARPDADAGDLGLDQGVDGPPAPDLRPDLPPPDAAPPKTVSTLAGTGQPGFNDGVAATAQFFNPRGVAVSGGTVYVADYANHRVRAIAGGQVTTLAGTGTQGLVDGPAATSQLNFPAALAVDAAGAVYVADSANDVIRKIAGGVVSTIAGDGTKGFADGPVAGAHFNFPSGIAVEGGAIYVADTENQRIRKIAAGLVSTIAGDGVKSFADGPAASARFSSPGGLAVAGGTVYVADTGNNRLRKIVAGVVSTLAGTGVQGDSDGPATSATFRGPMDVEVTGALLLVADQGNHRIRVLDQGSGVVSTLTGSYLGFNDGPLAGALFYYPSRLAVAGSVVYVADQSNHRIRVVMY